MEEKPLYLTIGDNPQLQTLKLEIENHFCNMHTSIRGQWFSLDNAFITATTPNLRSQVTN